MPRRLYLLQLVIGWLPMWALFATLIVTMHPGASLTWSVLFAFRMMVVAAVLGVLARPFMERLPWPHPFRLSFIAIHGAAALIYAVTWFVTNSLIESILHWNFIISIGPGVTPYLVIGVWLYVMLAGITYATGATERAARAEATAARSQLAALRSQLNPHFLFNALHTVVQLIPREPRRAAQAAERIGGLLRDTIEEARDLVPLAEERRFVERYLDVERLRFGDRLRVHIDVTDEADGAMIPSFALLTLVENAVRHGAEPSVEPTDVSVVGRALKRTIVLTVRDTGVGIGPNGAAQTNGTGLNRLRERLTALYGSRAALVVEPGSGRGFTVSLTIPRSDAE
jgi:signal transduction histidine kinase